MAMGEEESLRKQPEREGKEEGEEQVHGNYQRNRRMSRMSMQERWVSMQERWVSSKERWVSMQRWVHKKKRLSRQVG